MMQVKRAITQQERDLISGLLVLAKADFKIPEEVIPLNDGGMGSLQFSNQIISKFKEVIDVTYVDSDEVIVYISLRAYGGNLSEIDFWKTDFSELKVFPTINDVCITSK